MAATGKIGDRYRLARRIGVGGMARVYLTWDERLRVWCAVKVMTADAVRDSVMRARFVQEARTLARLAHPNLVRLFDLVDSVESPYMVMEYAEGGSVAERLVRGPLHLHQSLRAGAEMCAALEAAHAAGVIHRDVKPQNLLIDREGTIKVTDFGVARVEIDRMRLTMSNMSLGTLAYMPPEQQRDASAVDHRADIYAAGATLYALVTGRRPTSLLTQDRDRALALLPEPAGSIVRRATSPRREDRYASAMEMEDALREHLTQVPLPHGLPSIADHVEPPPSGPPIEELTLEPLELRELAGTERQYVAVAVTAHAPPMLPPITARPTVRSHFRSIDPSADSGPSAKTVELAPPRRRRGLRGVALLAVGGLAALACAGACAGLGAMVGGFGTLLAWQPV